MKERVIDGVHAQEARAREVVKQVAQRYGMKEPPTVHFKIPKIADSDADLAQVSEVLLEAAADEAPH